ncbi:hypothetical protein D918_08655 [Trichuris suis]|nr:hypothetical protein D918_08655 [Trichuris suis]
MNVTRLRETDAQGAYNVTREAAQVSLQAQQRADATEKTIGESETERRRTKELLDANLQDFNEQFKQNQAALDRLEQRAQELDAQIPELNLLVCGAKTESCDDLCGGAGCDKCGGPSCREGSVTKSEQAMQFSKEASEKLEEKQRRANTLVDRLRHAQGDSELALLDAKEAYGTAVRVAQVANDTRSVLAGLLERAKQFLKGEGANPEQIRVLAEQVLGMTISLDKEQIEAMAIDIGNNLRKLTNIQAILAETRGSMSLAQQLKSRADQAKVRIEAVERAAHEVISALNDSKHFQAVAKEAIGSASRNFQVASDDLDQIAETTKRTGETMDLSSQSLNKLREGLKKVEVEYLQIGKDVERALLVSNTSRQKMQETEERRKTLEQRYKETETLLEEKIGTSEAARQRAEQLRQMATKLLEKTEKHLSDIEELRNIVVVNEVTIDQVDSRLSALLLSVDEAGNSIQYHLKAYDHCSCQAEESRPDDHGGPLSCPLRY